MKNLTGFVWFCHLCCVFSLGCSGGAATPNRSNPGPSSEVAGSGVVPAANGGTSSPADNPTQPLSNAPSAGAAALGGICKPGHYIGAFSGNYRSAAWLDGTEALDFATGDFDGKPGFEFWLEAAAKPCPAGLEFCPEAVVSGGKLRGFATPFTDSSGGANADDPFQLSVRFEIDLTGELDCTAGKFRGQLQNGCYDVLSTLYRFAGTMKSGYDHATGAFTDGTWEVTEMPLDPSNPPTAAVGGGGMWDAKFVGPGMSPTVKGKALCDGMTGLDTPAP
jgi:hypothetical protein